MKQAQVTLNLFISYSHLDEENVKDFIKHIAPLKDKGLIKEWYDRKIEAGKDFDDTIFNNLENADIVCLFISANFLSSDSCKNEKNRALELRTKKGIAVVPIILSHCGWLDDKNISSLLALPEDGKPITEFSDVNKAWFTVYEELKNVIENEIKIKQLKTKDTFLEFLRNTELLSKAHSQKERVLLDDIFVYPYLMKFDDLGEYEKRSSSEILIEGFFYNHSKILIAGEDQSGKTSLCKRLYKELREKNFVPVFISDKKNLFAGKIENRIDTAFEEQYDSIKIKDFDKKRIVPIIDDFHFAQHKEKHIQDLSTYHNQIIIVDDIFNLNLKDENLIKNFTHFKVLEFKAVLINQLITKWLKLTDKKNGTVTSDNDFYQNIDKTTEIVNATLGKIFGSGIMPSYPFFILSILSTYETFERPLDQEITNQGYCYQALIYLYLRKQGVKNDEIDTYMNFLAELAFYYFSQRKNELSKSEFKSFMDKYLSKFNLPIKEEVLVKNLIQTQIILKDKLNNTAFGYLYLYYFFVAKYIAEHIEDNSKIIGKIINNLHKNENAYISIFISHHSKNVAILDEVILNSMCLFDKYEPATLSKKELDFFDGQEDIIIKAVLPPLTETPEKQRDRHLKSQEIVEQIDDYKEERSDDEDYKQLATELRRSVKTVEVMGQIIKSRAGSLEKERLENVFIEAMNVLLRIQSSFFALIGEKESQEEIIDYITKRLESVIQNEDKKPSKEKLKQMAKSMFWNSNFFLVMSIINKIVHSIGSDKLLSIVEKVCDSQNTPVSFIIKHGIFMWYDKNLQVENIASKIGDTNFSKIAQKALRFMIVKHCSMHSVGYKEKQRIEQKIGIPSKQLLLKELQKDDK